MKRRPGVRPHGQLRQSQVVTTFGPGALVDLPNYSVLIGGLDNWSPGSEVVREPRLVEKLERLLGVRTLELRTPPPENDDPTAPPTGITVWQFPEWFITQDVRDEENQGALRSRLLVHRSALTRGRFIDRDRRKRPVVPVRFVRACRRGHISDIDWYGFVHGHEDSCRRQLWMDERGTSGDLSEVWIRCECKKERSMIEAAGIEARALGNCDGARPWLGPYTRESCGEPSRLLVRTASNAYFPQLMSVISIPDRDEDLVKAVNQVWENFLEYVDSVDDLRRERTKKPPVQAALQGFSDEDVFSEIQSRKQETTGKPGVSVKELELETLAASRAELGEDKPDGDFYARALPRAEWERPWTGALDRVVLVHRLREVVASVGFTRFEASAPDVQGELEMGVSRASLAREIRWLPAIENRGEGVFLGFDASAVGAWLGKDAVTKRGETLVAGFEAWREEHHGTKRQFPGLPYVFLHSLSHLLITQMSLECGYPASSIRERVYATGSGFGILLYTGSPDAEGTLGGLVETGRRIHEHLRAALEMGELCSNDPVCAQHLPDEQHERRFLQGAACHGCLLIAETSCEQHNDFLDRALVVPTVDNLGAHFFDLGNVE